MLTIIYVGVATLSPLPPSRTWFIMSSRRMLAAGERERPGKKYPGEEKRRISIRKIQKKYLHPRKKVLERKIQFARAYSAKKGEIEWRCAFFFSPRNRISLGTFDAPKVKKRISPHVFIFYLPPSFFWPSRLRIHQFESGARSVDFSPLLQWYFWTGAKRRATDTFLSVVVVWTFSGEKTKKRQGNFFSRNTEKRRVIDLLPSQKKQPPPPPQVFGFDGFQRRRSNPRNHPSFAWWCSPLSTISLGGIPCISGASCCWTQPKIPVVNFLPIFARKSSFPAKNLKKSLLFFGEAFLDARQKHELVAREKEVSLCVSPLSPFYIFYGHIQSSISTGPSSSNLCNHFRAFEFTKF